MNLAKCSFAQKSVECEGHRLDAAGVHPTSEKLKATIEAQKPCDVKQLRSYLGLINYYAKFVPRMSTVLRPLHLLLMMDRKWKWSPECDKALERCNKLLLSHQGWLQMLHRLESVRCCRTSWRTEMKSRSRLRQGHYRRVSVTMRK